MYRKATPLFTAGVLLLLCVLTFMMFTAINAKYVQKTDNSVLYFNVIPLTYDCILEADSEFNKDVRAKYSEAEIDAIEILYFCSWERTSYTESGDGPLVGVPKSGVDFNWNEGVDVGLTVGSVRFFVDDSGDDVVGYVIARRGTDNKPNIIQANDASQNLFAGWDGLREIYFLDYNGDYDVNNMS